MYHKRIRLYTMNIAFIFMVISFAACSSTSAVLSESSNVGDPEHSSISQREIESEPVVSQSEPEQESNMADTAEENKETDASAIPEEKIDKQDISAITKVSVTIETAQGIAGRQEYTNPQQVKQLQGFIPGSDKLIPVEKRQPLAGGVGVVMECTSGDKIQQWVFTSGYAKHLKQDGSTDWYYTPKETWDLLLRMTDWNPDRLVDTPVYYRGELVTALYSFDGANRSYQYIQNPDKIAEIVPLLEKFTAETTGKAGALGFLLFTDKGKYAYSITEKSTELGQIATDCNEIYSFLRHAQWLCYMSAENIETIEFSGLGGSGYSLKDYPQQETFSIGVNTTSKDTIQKITSFLKNIKVEPNARVNEGLDNPVTVMGLIDMRIHFKTGTTYTIFGYLDEFSISTDDLNQSINYKTSEQQIQALRDFMALLPEATLQSSF